MQRGSDDELRLPGSPQTPTTRQRHSHIYKSSLNDNYQDLFLQSPHENTPQPCTQLTSFTSLYKLHSSPSLAADVFEDIQIFTGIALLIQGPQINCQITTRNILLSIKKPIELVLRNVQVGFLQAVFAELAPVLATWAARRFIRLINITTIGSFQVCLCQYINLLARDRITAVGSSCNSRWPQNPTGAKRARW